MIALTTATVTLPTTAVSGSNVVLNTQPMQCQTCLSNANQNDVFMCMLKNLLGGAISGTILNAEGENTKDISALTKELKDHCLSEEEKQDASTLTDCACF